MIRRFFLALLCCLPLTAAAQSPIQGFPPGTFGNVQASAPAGGGGGSTATLTFVAAQGVSQSGTSGGITFSHDIGSASANRKVILVFSMGNSYDAPITALTINSVSATCQNYAGTFGGFGSFRGQISFCYADVPTGSGSQSIVMTGGVDNGNGGFEVDSYTVDKTTLVNGSPTFGWNENDAVTSLSVTLNTGAGGFVISTAAYDQINATASAASVTSSTDAMTADDSPAFTGNQRVGPIYSKKSGVTASTPWTVTYGWTGASQALAAAMHWR